MVVIERGLQPNHSDWVRVVSKFTTDKQAEDAYKALVQKLAEDPDQVDIPTEDASLARDGNVFVYRVYTSGGTEDLEAWLDSQGALTVGVFIEGQDFNYDSLWSAVEDFNKTKISTNDRH